MKKIALAASAFVLAGAANAAVDTAAITSAQTDALAVVAALTTLGISVWGANYIRRKFFS
jgi:Inovirus Coat protein B|nr:MAG TPA: INOVIRUS (FILAMENTOUS BACTERIOPHAGE) STRAIN XF, Helical virus [Inoviridae sp.]